MLLRTERTNFVLTSREKAVLCRIAKAEGLSQAALLRWLLRQEAKRRGLWREALQVEDQQLAEEMER